MKVKAMKKTLSCILALTMAAGMMTGAAYAEEEPAAAEVTGVSEAPAETDAQPEPAQTDVDTVTENGFEVSADGVLTKYTGTETDVEIPSIVGGITVTAIGESAFQYNSSITSVTIPDTVTAIKGYAFYNCSKLGTVDFGKGMKTIGESAFQNCPKLVMIDLPDSVETIGSRAFAYCTSVGNVKLNDGLKTISAGAFSGCTAIVKVDIPNSVTLIDNNAFNDCTKLAKVTLSENITEINLGTFYGCQNLLSIKIPDAVTAIGEEAFRGCKLMTDAELSPNLVTIAGSAFSGCSSMNTVTFGNKLQTIAGSAFSGCSSMTAISIPDSVTSIGSGCFSGCSGAKTLKLSSEFELIPESAFSGCSSVTEIVIPSKVKTLGRSSFSNCDSLEKISLPDGLQVMYYDALYSCESLKSIVIPDSVYKIENEVFGSNTALTDVTIGSGMTAITQDPFWRCTNLTTLHVDTNLLSYGPDAFKYCTYLADIYYNGTTAEWEEVIRINENAALIKNKDNYDVHCTNGTIEGKKKVVGIVLTTPKKTEYEYGESLSTSGGKVAVKYADGSEGNATSLSSSMITGFDSQVPGKQTLTVTYGGKSTTFTVTVKSPSVKSIEVYVKPKTEYSLNEPMDLSGGKIRVTLTGGKTSEVGMTAEGVTVSGFTTAKSGKHTVTVKYLGKSATFEINVGKTEDATKSGVTMDGNPVVSVEKALKGIGNSDKSTHTIIITSPVTVNSFSFPANAPVVLKAEGEGKILTTAASLAPKAALTIECEIENTKNKKISINAKNDLTLTSGTYGNITVKGTPHLSGITVTGTLKFAKPDKNLSFTDTLEKVEIGKKFTTNSNVIFVDCPSIGTVAAKGTVKVEGDNTQAIAVTAKAKTGTSEISGLSVVKKTAIAHDLTASDCDFTGAVTVKGDAVISDSTFGNKLAVNKGLLTVNSKVTVNGAITCQGLNSTDSAELTYQSLAVTKNGITTGSAGIALYMVSKKGDPLTLEPGRSDITVVKTLKDSKVAKTKNDPDISALSVGGKPDVQLKASRGKVIIPKQ